MKVWVIRIRSRGADCWTWSRRPSTGGAGGDADDCTTISRVPSQNCRVWEQLAELQGGSVRGTNKNMETTRARETEQNVKKELAKKLGHLRGSWGS